MNEENEECSVLRTPLRSLTGHHGVVIAADWLPGGEQAVTAGWDRLACIWDTQTGQLLHQVSKSYYVIWYYLGLFSKHITDNFKLISSEAMMKNLPILRHIQRNV